MLDRWYDANFYAERAKAPLCATTIVVGGTITVLVPLCRPEPDLTELIVRVKRRLEKTFGPIEGR